MTRDPFPALNPQPTRTMTLLVRCRFIKHPLVVSFVSVRQVDLDSHLQGRVLAHRRISGCGLRAVVSSHFSGPLIKSADEHADDDPDECWCHCRAMWQRLGSTFQLSLLYVNLMARKPT